MILYSPRFGAKRHRSYFLCLFTSASVGGASINRLFVTVEGTYPDLAGGILRKARLEKLPKGIRVKTKEIQIDDGFLQKTMRKVDPGKKAVTI